MHAVIYTRLSKNRDNEKSATLEYQAERCREIATQEGWQVVDTLADSDMSGGKANRPGYLELKRLVEGGSVAVVICQDTDRLNRNAREAQDFRQLCAENDVIIRTWVGIEMSTETATGKLTTTMSDAVAEYYKNVVGDKVKAAHQRRLKEGKPNGGGRLFGEGGPDEAEAVRLLAKMTLQGESLNAMSRWLNSEGFKTTRGNTWQAGSLKNLLINPRLAGWLYYKGEKQGRITDYEPILDDDTHMKVRAVLTNPVTRANRGKPKRLLTSFLICSTCGGRMKGSKGQSKLIYTCSPENVMADGAKCSRRMTVTAVKADEVVVERMLRFIEAESDLQTVMASEAGAQLSGIRTRLDQIKAEKQGLAAAFGRLGDLEGLEAALEPLEAEEASLTAQVAPHALKPEGLNIRELWAKGSHPWRKALLAENIKTITVYPPQIASRNGFDPNRLLIGWKDSKRSGFTVKVDSPEDIQEIIERLAERGITVKVGENGMSRTRLEKVARRLLADGV